MVCKLVSTVAALHQVDFQLITNFFSLHLINVKGEWIHIDFYIIIYILFSLTVHPILKMLKSELGIFYLDDGTMRWGNLKMLHVTSIRLSKWVGS